VPTLEFTPEQHDLWKQIEKQITNEPKSFEMSSWCFWGNLGDQLNSRGVTLFKLEDVSCRTTACVAGWGVLLSGYHLDRGNFAYKDGGRNHVEVVAAALLGLPQVVADEIFGLPNHWGERVVKYAAKHGNLPVVEVFNELRLNRNKIYDSFPSS